MNKITRASILAILILIYGCKTNNDEYFGKFKTPIPEMINHGDAVSGKLKNAVKLMEMSFELSSTNLSVYKDQKEYLKMEYFRDGNCIIGKYNWGNEIVYFPIYFVDKNNAYSWGQKFVRIK